MNGSKLIISALGAAAALFATGLTVTASAREGAAVEQVSYSHRYDNRMNDRLAFRMLTSHNVERERLGLPRLKWNRNLESEAGRWGRVLARKGRLQHADQRTRNSTGENLWMGSAGQWDVETMVGMFIAEKQNYRHGNFPEISRTGNWYDAGHYSQIVWRDTQEVGCSVVTDKGWDVLVCRYWPAGNVWGQRAY